MIYVVDILCVKFCYSAYACILSLRGGSIKYCRIDNSPCRTCQSKCVLFLLAQAGNCAGTFCPTCFILLQGMISFVHMLHELSGGISHI